MTLRNLVLALFAVGLLSCSTSTEPEEEFEPYQVGSFLITSPETAEYTGIEGAQKVLSDSVVRDTVEITSPDNYYLEVQKDTAGDYGNVYGLKFLFADSTQRDRSNYINTNLYSPSEVINGGGGSASTGDDLLDVTIEVEVNCSVYNELQSLPYIYLRTSYGEDVELEKRIVYRIHVDGFLALLNEFTDC